MRAVVYSEYGGPEVLKLDRVQKPKPSKNELLIRVDYSSVTAGTLWIRKGGIPDSKLFTFFIRVFFGLFKPKNPILGFEFSGRIEEVGSEVKSFNVGDQVYGTTTTLKQGAYADFICVPQFKSSCVVRKKPEDLPLLEAAILPIGGMTAMDLILKSKLSANEKILVYGASGSVGSYGLQIAHYFGAEVIAACGASNQDWVKGLGCKEVLDYKNWSPSDLEDTFDVVFDAVGKLNKKEAKRMLAKGGRFVSVASPTKEKPNYLELLEEMNSKKKLTAVLDTCFPLSEIVQAHTYVELGRKKGNVAIDCRD